MDTFRRLQKESPVAVVSADRDTVVAFLVSLRESGRPAGTRLQAALAIDMYRRRVLMSDDPVLEDVLARLSELTETGGNDARKSDPESRAAGMPGPLNPNEPPVIRQLRTEIRLRHNSMNVSRIQRRI